MQELRFEHYTSESKFFWDAALEVVCHCADCPSTPQMQCLHCSKEICMECAQQHVAQSAEEIAAAKQVLITKASVLNQLAVAAKERVQIEREKIIRQADSVRDQAWLQIDELHELLKKQLEEKYIRLDQLSLDQVSPFIERMAEEMEDFEEDNEDFFHVHTTPAKIEIECEHGPPNVDERHSTVN